tara:strand:+ start:5326 stop:6057 length:732 start_codon:yes stop_codon:yes gene_type:complete
MKWEKIIRKSSDSLALIIRSNRLSRDRLENGKVLSDIESHMPAGHIYKDSDKITWGHETSHGIHSKLRMKFREGKKINGFYVLNNRAVIIEEPRTTIQAAARLVPRTLRGGVYQLYMVSQARSWGDTPLYVFDEWVAYANGAAVRRDLNIQSRQETCQYMLEFNVYSICVAKAANTNDPQFKNFLMWHLDRSMKLYEANKSLGDTSRTTAYWEKVKTSSDAESFRQYTRQYLGAEWTKEVLGF